MPLPQLSAYVLSLNSNWKRLLVILAPLCPENTNILSRHTATGKLQQDGGISPLWATWDGGAIQPKVLTGPQLAFLCTRRWDLHS